MSGLQRLVMTHRGITFVDLPGSGTRRWPKVTSIKRLQLASFACSLLVTAHRITENEAGLHVHGQHAAGTRSSRPRRPDLPRQPARHDLQSLLAAIEPCSAFLPRCRRVVEETQGMRI